MKQREVEKNQYSMGSENCNPSIGLEMFKVGCFCLDGLIADQKVIRLTIK